MGTGTCDRGILTGWRAIAEFLGWGEKKVRQLAERQGMPVYRNRDTRRVWARRDEVRSWYETWLTDASDSVAPSDPQRP